MNVIEALAHSPVCMEDVDVILTFAYLETDHLLRMPHSVEKVQLYKVYGEEKSTCAPFLWLPSAPSGLDGAIKDQLRVVLAPRDAVMTKDGSCIQRLLKRH